MGDIAYDSIKKSLDVTVLRQKVISNNIANLNTKNFKRSDVVFEEKLKDEIQRYGTHDTRVSKLEPEIKKDETTSFRMDNNNVDIDVEMTNQAANAIMYYSLISQFNNRIGIMRNVINEGRR